MVISTMKITVLGNFSSARKDGIIDVILSKA